MRCTGRGEPSEVVEEQLRLLGVGQGGAVTGVEVAQQAVAGTGVRQGAQLLLHEGEGAAGRGAAGPGLGEVDAGEVQLGPDARW